MKSEAFSSELGNSVDEPTPLEDNKRTSSNKIKKKSLSSKVALSEQAKEAVDNRFSLSSIMILSTFVDEYPNGLFGNLAKERYEDKFSIKLNYTINRIIATFVERGFLVETVSEIIDNGYTKQGPRRKYYKATDKAIQMVKFLDVIMRSGK